MILITTQNFPPDRGGIQSLLGGLADALHAAGEEIVVFADRVHETDVVDTPKPYRVERFGGLRPLRRWLKARAVAKAVKAHKVTGIFADSWKSVELLPDVGVPISVLVHGSELPHAPSGSKKGRIARAFAKAHAVVTNSNFSAGEARPYLSDGDKRLRVVHLPIAPQTAPSDAAVRAARGVIASDGPVILTVARLEERKGFDMVIRAMPEILRRHPNAVYVAAGGGDDLARLKRLAESEGTASRVRFVGPVDGDVKAAYYASADLFAMPARRVGNSVESFGIVYIEAGWYGVPSIAGRDGGAGDAVQDGVTGLLCDSFDAGDVARQILKLLDDVVLRKRLGDGARKRAREELNWESVLPRYLATLR